MTSTRASGATTGGKASSSRGIALATYAFTVTMLATTLPTPLYPRYEERFSFGALTVTIVFATYAVGVLVALLGFGRASDTLGRRPSLLAGLAASSLSSVVFVIVSQLHTGGLTMLLVGRFLSGLSAGVFTGTATAAIADFAGEHKFRGSVVAALANIGGLGLGPLVAGALAKGVAQPLITPYAVHLGLCALATAAVLAMPEPVEVRKPRRLQVQRLGVPAGIRATFIQAGIAGFAGFAVLGFFTAVSPATLGLLGYHDPLVTGVVVFVVFAASALGQLASVRLQLRPSLLGGTATLIAGIIIVGFGIGERSLALLVIGGIVVGAGQGMSFRSALGAVTGASPADQRGSVASSFFATCYVGISLPVIGVGAASDAYGLVRTGEVFSGIIAALGATALLGLARTGPAPGSREAAKSQ